MTNQLSGAADRLEGGARMQSEQVAGAGVGSVYYAVCRGPDGAVKWIEKIPNLVTTQGLNHLLDVAFKAATQITSWYVGLKGSGTPAAGDTHASHASWTEVTGYSEANRPAWTGGAVSGGSVTNSASKARFTANATITVAGAFMASNSTKGSTAAGGTLFNVADFAVARTMASGDTLDVTDALTVTAL